MRQPVARRVCRSLPILYCALALLLPAPARAQEDEPSNLTMAEPPADAVILSLQDVMNAALEHNLDIAVRRYDPLRSQTQVTLQESLYDPSITGTARSSQDQQSRISSFIGQFTSEDKSHVYTTGFEDPLIIGGSYRFEFSASDNDTSITNVGGTSNDLGFNTSWTLTYRQSLLRNMGAQVNRWQILVARDNLQVSEETFRESVLSTLSDAEKAYWDLNFALMELQTQRASLRLAQEFLEQNKIKVRVGTLAPIEITQAEADVADRDEKVIVAEHLILQREDELRRVMNVPPDSPWWNRSIRPSDAPPFDIVELDMAHEVNEALKHRPDLNQARVDVRSKDTELFARKNERRWGLDFEGTYGALGFDGGDPAIPANSPPFSYSGSLEDLDDRNQTSWSLGLTLTVPIGNRSAIANYIDAEHALNQSHFELQRREQQARVEVRSAVRSVLTNIKRVLATRASVRLQREKLEAEQKKFENGMSTSFQVLTFQNDLTASRSRENLAIVDYNKSVVELERVKGTLLEARRMLLPGEMASPGGDHSALLRSIWQRNPSPGVTMANQMADDLPATMALPTDFVFRDHRIVGIGGTIEIGEKSTAGR